MAIFFKGGEHFFNHKKRHTPIPNNHFFSCFFWIVYFFKRGNQIWPWQVFRLGYYQYYFWYNVLPFEVYIS